MVGILKGLMHQVLSFHTQFFKQEIQIFRALGRQKFNFLAGPAVNKAKLSQVFDRQQKPAVLFDLPVVCFVREFFPQNSCSTKIC